MRIVTAREQLELLSPWLVFEGSINHSQMPQDWRSAPLYTREAGVGDEVLEHLKRHPGGITFKHHPGDGPTKGYMVSLPHAEKSQDDATMTPEDVDRYHQDHPEIQEPDNYHGLWHEPPKYVHDVSRNIEDSYDTGRAAVDWRQRAVFDNDKHDPKGNPLDSAYIYTNPLANSGPASAVGWTQAKRRYAMPWYHVSPHDLPKGTRLTPHGGESGFGDVGGGRGDHVWVTDSPEHARDWASTMYEQSGNWPGHLYEVEPNREPQVHDLEYPDDEWKVPSATIKTKLTPGWLKTPRYLNGE